MLTLEGSALPSVLSGAHANYSVNLNLDRSHVKLELQEAVAGSLTEVVSYAIDDRPPSGTSAIIAPPKNALGIVMH